MINLGGKLLSNHNYENGFWNSKKFFYKYQKKFFFFPEGTHNRKKKNVEKD